jgi:hypothetical protein
MTDEKTITGACACSTVKYSLSGEMVGVVNCHCKQCQRFHGNYHPLIVGEKENFVVIKGEENITKFDSSELAQRFFCSKCGSQIFKKQTEGSKVMLSVGCLDDTEGLKTVKNIFTESAGTYYVMPRIES